MMSESHYKPEHLNSNEEYKQIVRTTSFYVPIYSHLASVPATESRLHVALKDRKTCLSS